MRDGGTAEIGNCRMTRRRVVNFAGKAAYSYKDRYFLQGAANYSGYDRYAPGHQYGLFYAGGAGWASCAAGRNACADR